MKPKKESFKVGRKKFGEIYRWEDGRSCFVIQRSRKDIYRGKNSFVSHAMEDGEAMWSVETMILSKVREHRIDFVAIKVREDGAVYLTPLERYIREGRIVTHRRRNGSAQRSLPLQRFWKKDGRIKL